MQKRFIKFTDEKLKPKVQIEDGVFLYHELIGEATFKFGIRFTDK